VSAIKPLCIGCNKRPIELAEYRAAAEGEDFSPDDYVRAREGTYNSENGHFLCTPCYINAGMPGSVSGWVAP